MQLGVQFLHALCKKKTEDNRQMSRCEVALPLKYDSQTVIRFVRKAAQFTAYLDLISVAKQLRRLMPGKKSRKRINRQ